MSQHAAVPHRSTENQDVLQALVSQEMLARAVRTALQLRLAEAIRKEPCSTEDLARTTGVQAAPLGRLLRALADNGIFREVAAGRFAHNAISERLRADHPHSAAAMLSLGGLPSNDRAWAALPAAMRVGKPPFEEAFGQKLYPYLASHAEEGDLFNRAMVDNTSIAIEAVIRAYPSFKTRKRVLDVGGGFGQAVAAILEHHAHLQGGVFDQAHLEAPACAYLDEQKLSQRCTFVAGDFLKSLPTGFDVYMIKNVLWNWGDDDVKRILTNIARAMGTDPQARLMVIETLLGEGHTGYASLLDVQMLVMPNGRSRSRAQYDALAQSAGLSPDEAIVANPQTTVLTYKAAPHEATR